MRLECKDCKERVPQDEMTAGLCYHCYEKAMKFSNEELFKILATVIPPDANPRTGIPYGEME